MSNNNLIYVRPETLRISPLHRRSKWGDMAGLRESVVKYGLLQPIIVHTCDDDGLEILAGVRRQQAATDAGLEQVPVIVREVSQDEVIAIQLEENLCREDLHPLDEAELYELAGAGGTAEKVAARHGKTRAHVLQRLQLLQLNDRLQERYRKGELAHAVAYAASRVRRELQEEAVDEMLVVIEERPGSLAEELEDLIWTIKERYMTALSSAPFNCQDDTLPPRPCARCQHRSDAQVELFPELQANQAYCLDRTCFDAKIQTSWERARTEAEAKGLKVVESTERTEYLRPNSVATWGKSGQPRTVEQLVKAAGAVVQPVMVKTQEGGAELRYPRKQVNKLAKEYEAKQGKAKQEPAEKLKEQRRIVAEAYETVMRTFFDRGRDEQLAFLGSGPVWLAMFRCLDYSCRFTPIMEAVTKAHGLPRDEDVEPKGEANARGYVFELLARQVSGGGMPHNDEWPGELRQLGAVLGIDVEKVATAAVKAATKKAPATGRRTKQPVAASKTSPITQGDKKGRARETGTVKQPTKASGKTSPQKRPEKASKPVATT